MRRPKEDQQTNDEHDNGDDEEEGNPRIMVSAQQRLRSAFRLDDAAAECNGRIRPDSRLGWYTS